MLNLSKMDKKTELIAKHFSFAIDVAPEASLAYEDGLMVYSCNESLFKVVMSDDVFKSVKEYFEDSRAGVIKRMEAQKRKQAKLAKKIPLKRGAK